MIQNGISPRGRVAVDLAAVGWPVIPIHWVVPNGDGWVCSCPKGKDCARDSGKHPLIVGGRGWENASSDPDLVQAWWEEWPLANIAVHMALTVCIDCDVDEDLGEDGYLELLQTLAARGIELPSTRMHETGGGGRHILLGQPNNGQPRITNGKLLPHVDIKSVGGYILWPGSQHVSGREYRELTPHGTPIAPMDSSLAAVLNQRHGASGPARSGESLSYDYQRAKLDGPRVGCRDQFFNDYAFELRKRGWPPADALTEIRRLWDLTEQRDDDLYPLDKALEKVKRIWEDDRIEPDAPTEIPSWPAGVATSKQMDTWEDAKRLAALTPHQGWLQRVQNHTDDGNARLFVSQHANAVRFATDTEVWYAWDGTRWVPNASLAVLDLARATARSLTVLVANVSEDDPRKRALAHAHTSLGSGRIQAIPNLAKSDPDIAVRASEFDWDPLLLNTPSGVVDLRDGSRRDHRREDLCARLTGVPYEPDARADNWLRWLQWASNGRSDWIEYMQRVAGYALTGITTEQTFWFHHGVGANGKTTWLSVMDRVLGDYAWHAEGDLLVAKRAGGATTGLVDLMGRRFVVVSETREGQRWDERLLKDLSGEEVVTGRRLYENNVEFTPTHKLHISGNHKPPVRDDSYAFWRRIHLVPWDAIVAEDRRQPGVADWIVEYEGPGVLTGAVQGCLKWQQDGLQVPSYVREGTERYRHDEDLLGAFLATHLVEDPQGFAIGVELHTTYRAWCDTEHVDRRQVLGRNMFLQKVEERLRVPRTRRTMGMGDERVTPHGFAGWRIVTEGEI